jgi:hypothetical protein
MTTAAIPASAVSKGLSQKHRFRAYFSQHYLLFSPSLLCVLAEPE